MRVATQLKLALKTCEKVLHNSQKKTNSLEKNAHKKIIKNITVK
jgi:hypothetical protein